MIKARTSLKFILNLNYAFRVFGAFSSIDGVALTRAVVPSALPYDGPLNDAKESLCAFYGLAEVAVGSHTTTIEQL